MEVLAGLLSFLLRNQIEDTKHVTSALIPERSVLTLRVRSE